MLDKSRFNEVCIDGISVLAYVRCVSSACMFAFDVDKQLGKSLIYSRNSKGPRIVPWGIPHCKVRLSEINPFMMHFCMRLSKYEHNKSWAFP